MNQPGWGPQGQQPPTPKKGMSVFSGVLLALFVFFIVLPFGGAMTCMVCTKLRADKVAEEVASARGAEARQAAPVPSQQTPLGFSGTVSVANFTKDTRLDECDDFIVTVPPDATDGSDLLARTLDNVSQSFVKGKKKSMPGLSKIGRPCAEQFRVNQALATCVVHHVGKLDSGIGLAVGIVGRYYDLDTLTSNDTYMKNCIDMNGDWQAVDKDSDEYREAVRERARREVEGLRKSLGN
jgi:cell division protein FtsB